MYLLHDMWFCRFLSCMYYESLAPYRGFLSNGSNKMPHLINNFHESRRCTLYICHLRHASCNLMQSEISITLQVI